MKRNDVISLDEAVYDCLCRYSDDTSVRRGMCGTILVVGGGALLTGLVETLVERVGRRLGVESITARCRHQCDSLSWHGASLMSRMQTTADLWISAEEWSCRGISAFRDKSIFI